ncbi:MAG: hypothetical protein BMS9Abin36_0634 [Gammaproteobacteria bacterium]|nr:MAG: hypothetical protein BMS9Abin36_0634 [Gammaproteobacteria bacterium]
MKTRAQIITISLLLASAVVWQATAANSTSLSSPTVTVGTSEKDGRYMIDVTLHEPSDIRALLTRAEMLSKTIRVNKNSSGIALVLHGEEIKLFNKKNFKQYRDIVNKAARLDAEHVIEIKICKSKMQEMGIKKKDLPAFIDLVPYGPDEIERLQRNGYVYL